MHSMIVFFYILMDKKYRKIIDYRILQQVKDNSINASMLSGLRRIRRTYKYIFNGILSCVACYAFYSYIKNTMKQISNQVKFLNTQMTLENMNYMLNAHKKSINISNGTMDTKDHIIKDSFKYRNQLLSKAEGIILETCCGDLKENLKLYQINQEKIKKIVAIDWCDEAIEIAQKSNSSVPNLMFLKMNAFNLEFQNETFDTVIDTFGMQYSHNPIDQYLEMKRVCKKGGKILILESGKSHWYSDNFKMIRNFDKTLREQGSIPFIDWNQIILKDPQIEVVAHKRRKNGRLYYFELRKKE